MLYPDLVPTARPTDPTSTPTTAAPVTEAPIDRNDVSVYQILQQNSLLLTSANEHCYLSLLYCAALECEILW